MELFNPQSIPLLDKKSIDEDVLYVFVFPNFFSEEPEISEPLSEKISLDETRRIFNSIFKIIESNETEQKTQVLDKELLEIPKTRQRASSNLIKNIPKSRLD